jgi:hypothetical protein
MKISDTKAVNAANKKKKSGKAGATEKAKFASLVDAAMEKKEEDAAKPSEYGQKKNISDESQAFVPEQAEERGVYMLDTLEDLEKDILSGNPTDAIAKLKEALATRAINLEQLSPKMRQLLDEIDLRASIEVAKLED